MRSMKNDACHPGEWRRYQLSRRDVAGSASFPARGGALTRSVFVRRVRKEVRVRVHTNECVSANLKPLTRVAHWLSMRKLRNVECGRLEARHKPPG